MIHLEHLNLVVSNMDKALAFYQAAFPHWRVRGGGHQNWYGTERNWLHFGDDYQYLTLNDSGEGENRELSSNQVGLAHFAYVTDNLDALIGRMRAAGFAPSKGGKSLYRSNAYFIDADGFEVEFVQYHSDLPSQRNYYE